MIVVVVVVVAAGIVSGIRAKSAECAEHRDAYVRTSSLPTCLALTAVLSFRL